MNILFYGEDGAAAKAIANARRAEKQPVRLLHALVCHEAEPCDGIEFLPDVSAFDRERLTALFGVKAAPAPSVEVERPVDEPQADDGLKIGKGPGGRIYIRQGSTIHSGPFGTFRDAKAALETLRGA